MKKLLFFILLLGLIIACTPESAETPPLKVGVVLEAGSENDKSFNEYTLKGAREAAEAADLNFSYIVSASVKEYEQNVEQMVQEGADLVITVGFRFGEATADVARRHPETHFAIVDNAYYPGLGCPNTVKDCYTEEGGLTNVTSLMFAEDQVGYLAGVLAACMSETGKVASVAGMEIPPVVRFVTGFQEGAHSVEADIETFNQYIPDFNDPETGKVVAQGFISEGADVIFAAGGNTGNGGLLAAYEAGKMSIGVDVDQYHTYPEVQSSLLSSASKKVDVAAARAVEDFAQDELEHGIRVATLESGGVGLAPYHDWVDKIPQECKDKVKEAEEAIKADETITGAR